MLARLSQLKQVLGATAAGWTCPVALQQVQPQAHLQQVRHVNNRTRLYGFEEGHSCKNEVRKLKWVRKHKIRPTGQGWRRQERGLPPDPFKSHALVTRPDWSHEDGMPGALSASQAEAVLIMRDLCRDVKNAIDHVNRKV